MIVKAGADTAGRSCPYCRFPIKEGAEVTVCPACGSSHHAECWSDNDGCAIVACAGGPDHTSAPPSEARTQPMRVPAPASPVPHPSRPPAGYAAPGRLSRDRARNGVLFASLVAILVLGAALAFAIGKNSSGGATTTELVKTDASNKSSARAASTASAKSSSASASSSPSSSQRAPSTPGLQSYSGSNFSMMVPSAWTQDVDERRIGQEAESKWSNPSNASEYVLLDVHTPVHVTMHEGAEPVHEQLTKQPGYTQVYYGPGDLTRHPGSWMWIFEIEGNERIDYFFETCSNTMGVLGSATPSRFGELRGMFREVADSFRSSCE